MAAEDIIRVVTTVATIQLFCDLVAYWRVYSKEPYQRSLDQLSRAKFKFDKVKEEVSKEETTATTAATSNKKATKAERLAKKLQRSEDDYGNARANVARRHTGPGMLTSILFFILLRVLGTEYQGKIVAILPFAPFSLLKRITSRGLEFAPFESDNPKVDEVSQACAFMFIYLLTTASIKYYVTRLVGTKAPEGAEGMMAIMDSPVGQAALKSAGIDPNELKAE